MIKTGIKVLYIFILSHFIVLLLVPCFSNQAYACASWLLKIAFAPCLYVCMSSLRLLLTHVQWSCINQLNKSYNLPLACFIWHLPPIFWKVMFLGAKLIISASQCKREKKVMLFLCFNSKTRWSTSSLKVSGRTHREVFKRWLYS